MNILTLEKLWRSIGRAPAKRVQLVPVDELVGEAEVGDLDVHLAVQQEVLGLQVSVDDLLLVAILNGRDDLKLNIKHYLWIAIKRTNQA